MVKPMPTNQPTRTALAEMHADSSSLPSMRDATTLLEVLDWHTETHADHTHVHFLSGGPSQTLSYGALNDRSQSVATHLQALGLQPHQSVAIMLPSGLDFFYTFFGVLRAGLVPVPLCPPTNWAHLEDHLSRQAGILTNCKAPILVTVPAAKLFGRLLRLYAPTLKQVVTVEELLAPAPTRLFDRVGAGDTALLQYTSGSTASPKGVILTHANLLANIRAFTTATTMNATDVCVSWLPLFHDMGLIGTWLGSLYTGCPLVLMSPRYFLAHPQRWLWAIHQHRGTISAAPNFAYEFCVRKIADRDIAGLDLSSWRWAGNGAEPVRAETLARFSQRFATHGFRTEALAPVYGLAECSLALTCPPLGRPARVDRVQRAPLLDDGLAMPALMDDQSAIGYVSCGAPLAGCEVRVVDAVDIELPDRSVGHVHFRGPSATSGYLDNEQETRKLFHGDWLDTGDLGYLAAGELYLTGRTKDVIICNGRKLYPHELEDAIGNLSGVRRGSVVVFGVSQKDRATDSLIVVAETRVVDARHRDVLKITVNALSMKLLGLTPRAVIWLSKHAVLKSSSGKLRRNAMKALYEQGALHHGKALLPWQLLRIAYRAMARVLRRRPGRVVPRNDDCKGDFL